MNRANSTGATPGGYSDTGNTSIGSPVITNLSGTGGINIGDYVEVSAGFPPWGYLRVENKTVNTITLETNATSAQTGVSVTSKAKMYTDGIAGIVARTILGARYMNLIQEELCNLVLDAGGTLSDVIKNQLSGLVIRINGGQIMTGDLGFPSYQFVKKVTGTEADTTKNIQMSGGGYYIFNSIAAATNKKIFEFGSTIDERWFLIKLTMHFLYNGTVDRVAFCNLVIKTGKSGSPGETQVLVPLQADASYASDTPVNLGGYYLNERNIGSPVNDAIFDGATAKNEVPMIIVKHNEITIRNSHTANSFSNIRLFLKVGNLFLS